jgi:anti-anti-sigma regulatory factor
MAATAGDLELNPFHITMRRIGRHVRVLDATGVLSFDTAEELRSVYHQTVKSEGGQMNRLLLDLRDIHRFDVTGVTTLLELSRDAQFRSLRFEIVDNADRPVYVSTGLNDRLRFLTGRALEVLER